MEVRKHVVKPCHKHSIFNYHCHECLVETVVGLCELLEEHPETIDEDEMGRSNSLTEVFKGIHVAHITEGHITNVTALPVTELDLSEGIVRYTVEIRKD